MSFRVAEPPVRSLTRPPGSRVLIVDDDPFILKVLRRMLVQDRHVVVDAASGDEALLRVAELGFDLIVSDVRMRGMNGLELLRQVSESHPEVPVVLISGYPSVEIAAAAIQLGAVDYLEKPIRFETFRATVLRALEVRRQRVEAASIPSLRERGSSK